MVSTLELTDWLGKQRRAYHKHDGFPEHPVRVKHHQEYFAGDVVQPDKPREFPQQDLTDIHDEIKIKLLNALLDKPKIVSWSGVTNPSDLVVNWSLGNQSRQEESIKFLGEVLDTVLSDEDFVALLQGLDNSHSLDREVLQEKHDRFMEILMEVGARGPEWNKTYAEKEENKKALDSLKHQERFFKDVVLATRPIPLLINNIGTLVNSDKGYMNETAFALFDVDPTADFLMNIVNANWLDFKVRTKALLALDAKRFDEVMSERYGSDWLDIEDWTEDFKMGDVRIEVLEKQRKVKELHNVFGRDAVNHFIEHLEFPEEGFSSPKREALEAKKARLRSSIKEAQGKGEEVEQDIYDDYGAVSEELAGMEFASDFRGVFNVMKKDPGEEAKNLFIELYSNTQFGTLHKASMLQWEASSSSDWAGLLKESIGRQLDGDVIFHSGVTVDKLQEMYLPSRPQRLTDFGYDEEDHIKYVTTQDNLDKYVLTHKKAIRKILDSVYKDQDYIPIYRGTGATGGEVEETTHIEDYKEGEWHSIDVLANPISSYSLDSSVAKRFALTGKGQFDRGNGWIISSLVHKDDIWSTFWSHSYEGNEREFILINKERESVGIRVEPWEKEGSHKSPLAFSYNKFGFQSTAKNPPYIFTDREKERIDELVSNIQKPSTVKTRAALDKSAKAYLTAFDGLKNRLDYFIDRNDMPVFQALEIWTNSMRNAGWKTNPKLQDSIYFDYIPSRIKEFTEDFETRAGEEAMVL